MSEYRPDRWQLFKLVTPEGVYYKVLAGWSGGYLGADSWKINSGITKIEETLREYRFHGHSGSVYVCRKTAEGLTSLTANVWESLVRDIPAGVSLSLTSVDEARAGLKEPT